MAEKDYKKKIEFDADGERFYETGVKNVVLYLKKNMTADENPKPYNNGVAWNGVTSISENPSGAETTKLYADDIAYLSLTSNEEFGATIEAYMSPEEFDVCDGSADLADGVSIGQKYLVLLTRLYTATTKMATTKATSSILFTAPKRLPLPKHMRQSTSRPKLLPYLGSSQQLPFL